MTEHARAAAEETARASYGRLVAWLSSRTRDLAAVEDALSDAFRAALETWPDKGVPASPEAWLLTTARRKLIDGSRRRSVQTAAIPALQLAADEASAAAGAETFPDERLKLMFICAHPAIDASVRTPMMLQTVLGLDAARIAAAFAVSPAAMSGRLVRAKRKIKAAGIPFETPDAHDLPARLSSVHDAIYAAFTAGWDDAGAGNETHDDLAQEAIYLGRLITDLLPANAEGWGLLSLMLHAEARRAARRENGAYVPLSQQNVERWDRGMIADAERALQRAWSLQAPGRFQLEAAIQSAHAAAKLHGRETAEDIVILYRRLIEIAPSLGASTSYAAALDRVGRADEALGVLDAIENKQADAYQPYWAIRAHVLKSLSRRADADAAFERAKALSTDAAAVRFLEGARAEISSEDGS